MKLEVENSATHLRAMRDTLDNFRTWLAGYAVGAKAHGGGSAFVGGELHLGQIRMLLTELTHQAEKLETAKASSKR
jgi:hypothetical protein